MTILPDNYGRRRNRAPLLLPFVVVLALGFCAFFSLASVVIR